MKTQWGERYFFIRAGSLHPKRSEPSQDESSINSLTNESARKLPHKESSGAFEAKWCQVQAGLPLLDLLSADRLSIVIDREAYDSTRRVALECEWRSPVLHRVLEFAFGDEIKGGA